MRLSIRCTNTISLLRSMSRIVSEAFEIGDALGGEVHIRHVFNPYLDPEDPDRIEQQHAEALENWPVQQQVPEERTHMHAGNPTDLLPKISADMGADLVIMGAYRAPGSKTSLSAVLPRMFSIGLGCDVLVLKPKGYMSPVTFKTVPKGAVFAD